MGVKVLNLLKKKIIIKINYISRDIYELKLIIKQKSPCVYEIVVIFL